MKFFGNTFKIAFWSMILILLLSFLSFLYPSLNPVLFFAIGIVVFCLSLKRLDWGLYAVLGELAIGSMGYLFYYDFKDFRVSIRLFLFLSVFLAWFIHFVKDKKIVFRKTNLFLPYLVLILILALGAIIGIVRGNFLKNIFFDVNGYLYFGLIFAFFYIINSREKISKILQILFAAVSVMTAKALFLLFVFSHGLQSIAFILYQWVRETGTGEIATKASGLVRVFSQSQIYSLFTLALIISILIFTKQVSKLSWSLWIFILFNCSLILISGSRSFWLGLSLGTLTLFLFLIISYKLPIKKLVTPVLVLIVGFGTSYVLVLGIMKFPWPKIENQVGFGSLIKERIGDMGTEEAVASRFLLLNPLLKEVSKYPILGSGFGSTVTYQTKDPHALKYHPEGYVTTYAFEWGYLDILLKVGIVGLLIYLFFLGKILKNGWQILSKETLSRSNKGIIFGFSLGLLVLIFIHITTPYLNHPLGIGYIMLVAAVFRVFTDNH